MTGRRSTASPLEKSIVAAVVAAMRTRGAWVAKTHGGYYGRAGIPDLLCCYRGHFVALEVKRPGGAGATPLQAAQLEGVRRASGTALVIRSADEAIVVLDEIDRMRAPRP